MKQKFFPYPPKELNDSDENFTTDNNNTFLTEYLTEKERQLQEENHQIMALSIASGLYLYLLGQESSFTVAEGSEDIAS